MLYHCRSTFTSNTVSRKSIGKIEVADTLPFPAVQDGISLITFAKAADFADQIGPDLYVAEESKPFEVRKQLDESDFGRHLFRLLRLAWELTLAERELPIYELANQIKSYYFPKDLLPADKAFYIGLDGNRTYRAMVGYSSRTNPTSGESKKRYWHFGLEARPMVYPTLAYVIKPHVGFTSDGATLWESKRMLASARRSQCKGWWNDKWRDMILAAMTYLADDDGIIRMKLGSDVTLSLPNRPIGFTSPVAYTDPQILREVELEQLADDYGRDDEEPEAYGDDAEVAELRELLHLPEPCLLFGHQQATEAPRDGLTLFGPLDRCKPYGVKAGVIGTKRGIEIFKRWVEWVQRPVLTVPPVLGRPPFLDSRQSSAHPGILGPFSRSRSATRTLTSPYISTNRTNASTER